MSWNEQSIDMLPAHLPFFQRRQENFMHIEEAYESSRLEIDNMDAHVCKSNLPFDGCVEKTLFE